eukprot:Protomagalhaensia_wolfi_Nauph_80__3914@NODE_3970_length_668_cov_4_548490_g3146_i0_p1_GENE_NODE_3970_length_668_cov_4_548490_g3146_i0NODE_3970_length_668_cov_4_548490_g3146_i0_p1_ORF_typecomplete_len108_score10_67_NODE_3970_length_668_cov_4_548490_g3146_i058381
MPPYVQNASHSSNCQGSPDLPLQMGSSALLPCGTSNLVNLTPPSIAPNLATLHSLSGPKEQDTEPSPPLQYALSQANRALRRHPHYVKQNCVVIVNNRHNSVVIGQI